MNYSLEKQITCIDTGHIRQQFVAAYLIKSNNEVAFVDTGSHLSIPNLLNALEEADCSVSQVKYIFVTHIHLDHAGGAGGLLKHCPKAKVVVHEKGAKHLINPEKLKSGVISVYGEIFFGQYLGDIVPIDKDRLIVANSGNFLLGNRRLTLINTPGHARHHYCIYDEQSQGIFSGDTLGVSYEALNTPQKFFIFPPTSPTQFEPKVWKDTIDKLIKYQPKYAYLTHFNRIDFNQNCADQLKKRIDDVSQIAQAVAQESMDKNTRHQRIKQQITHYFLKEIAGVDVEKTQKLAILKDDIEICTQGLVVWLGYLN